MQYKHAYISGPMTGYANYNRAAFEEAEERLKKFFPDMINPLKLPDPEGLTGDPEYDWTLYLARDMAIISKKVCYLIMLPGWKKSRGARLEKQFADNIGILTYEYSWMIELVEVLKQQQ